MIFALQKHSLSKYLKLSKQIKIIDTDAKYSYIIQLQTACLHLPAL